jgi:HAD superfamily hydrolase (TIGR01549 family)
MATIIFDFDGTIADSFDFVADFLADEADGQTLSEAQKQALRGRSMFAMARQLGHARWRLLRLLFKGRKRMSEAIGQIKPFAGMPEVIEKLHAEGHELFILSSNSMPNVRAFLHEHELHTYFLEIYGSVGLFGKASALRHLLKEQRLEKADAVYVGDEVRDVQAARSINLRVIAVSWGFARLGGLEAHEPTALAKDPADLMKILEEL